MTNLKKALFFALFAGIIGIYLASCGKSETIIEEVTGNEEDMIYLRGDHRILPLEEVDDFIINRIIDGGFEWEDMSVRLLHSSIMHNNSIASISYIPDDYTSMEDFYSSDAIIQAYDNTNRLPAECVTKRNQIIHKILEKERTYRNQPELSVQDILPFGYDEKLPHIYIKITNPLTIMELVNDNSITGIAPGSYDTSNVLRSFATLYAENSGCTAPEAASDPIPVENYSEIRNGSLVSWNYPDNGITQAWDTPISPPGKAAGEGIRVCVIDTGISEDHTNLHQRFATGLSAGRSPVETRVTRTIAPESQPGSFETITAFAPLRDECGHGTSMAGIVAAPLAGDMNSTGVAYRADLTTIKASLDVWVSSDIDDQGLSAALWIAGMDDDIKIISISLGSLLPWPLVVNAANLAAGRGKLIFAAAGTSTSFSNFGVLYPARLGSNITVAVTGVNQELDDMGRTIKCSNCHTGSQVDFSVVMEKGTDDTGPLTLPLELNPDDPNRPKYSSGTSSATATAAGIAALVWAAHPNATKGQIYSRLLLSAEQNTPIPDIGHGFGVIHAEKAINAQL